MFEENKWILGIIVGSMTLSGLAILDELVIQVIFSASGVIAYSLVGSLLGTGLITSRADAGRARMGIFIFLVFIFVSIYLMIIKIITWLLSFPLWVYVIIFIVTLGILIVRFILNRKAESNYVDAHKNDLLKDYDTVEVNEKETIENWNPNILTEEPKSIYQLLDENKEKDVIYVVRVDNGSPGLQYVQVNQKAVKYQILKGYLKFDNAGVFREIYYANEKIWRIY